ncbi:hypothetical protein CJU90_5306 [Yarrowia sp. C11]|nr:hypothetical protein CJU90_5306 [Yarrowia sp. C11]KAG5363909.1 hypothetical protein CKK34_2684 [Yarrowia sp. E02]
MRPFHAVFGLVALSTLAQSLGLAISSDLLYARNVNTNKSYGNTTVECLMESLSIGAALTVVIERRKVDVASLDRLLDQLEEAPPPLTAAVTTQLVNGDVSEYVELFKVYGEDLGTLVRNDGGLTDALTEWGADLACANLVAKLVGSQYDFESVDKSFDLLEQL